MTLRPRTLRARQLRRDPTHAEHLLWRALRESALPGRFRRQHPIGRHIADFACPAAKLVIELDGGQHAIDRTQDAARSAELDAHGYRVIRFWNNEVTQNLDGVLQRILRELAHPPPPPTPPPPRAEGHPNTARTISPPPCGAEGLSSFSPPPCGAEGLSSFSPPPLGAEGLGEVGDPLT